MLFADVSGSTRLYEYLGDTLAFATINNCLTILRRLTEAHQGRVVKTIGDEIMAVFPDAGLAVQTACEMQLEMKAQPPVGNAQVAIRIGFHYGSVIESGQGDGDVFGDTVNIAARMASIANGGQIITSETTVKQLPPIMRSSIRALDALTVKGKAEDIQVFEVIWQESSEMTMMVSRTLTPSLAEPVVRLIHAGQEFIVNAQRLSLTLGRGEQADIIFQDRRASRMHGRIERRRDKFVFVDQSANGSYLTFSGEDEIELRREEVVLRGNGSISLGHPYRKDPSETVEFFCE
ncbi:MAG: FHA domain-containing protein [Gammaproteobacteria bacterium]|nr:FHA domain-containing protein [Gammaproteobacteria bacterium]